MWVSGGRRLGLRRALPTALLAVMILAGLAPSGAARGDVPVPSSGGIAAVVAVPGTAAGIQVRANRGPFHVVAWPGRQGTAPLAIAAGDWRAAVGTSRWRAAASAAASPALPRIETCQGRAPPRCGAALTAAPAGGARHR